MGWLVNVVSGVLTNPVEMTLVDFWLTENPVMVPPKLDITCVGMIATPHDTTRAVEVRAPMVVPFGATSPVENWTVDGAEPAVVVNRIFPELISVPGTRFNTNPVQLSVLGVPFACAEIENRMIVLVQKEGVWSVSGILAPKTPKGFNKEAA